MVRQVLGGIIPVTMEVILMCPACGHENSLDDSYCAGCRVSLDRASRITQEEARDLQLSRDAVARRQRRVRLAQIVLVLLILGGWIGYRTVFADNPGSLASEISANPVPGDWPMFNRDPAHAAFVSDDIPIPEGRVQWQFESKTLIVSSPAVVQGTVYLGTGDGRIVALDGQTGEIIWEYNVTTPVDTSPAVAGDLVFVGLRDGRLLALAKADGSFQWEFSTGELIYSSPAVYQGVVFIGSGDGKLYALDAVTGERRWSYSTDGRVFSAPAVHEDIIAVTSQDRHIYILDAATGQHRLDYLISETRGSPSFDGELAYVADSGGTLIAIDWSQRELPLEKIVRRLRTQMFIWGLIGSNPPLKGFVWGITRPRESFVGTPAAGFGMVYVATRSGSVLGLDRSDGQEVWKFSAGAQITQSPSIAGQTLYVGDANGVVHGVDALTGEARWQFQVDDGISSTPVLANGMLYVASDSGTLYAIR